jgi:hypothetical protein
LRRDPPPLSERKKKARDNYGKEEKLIEDQNESAGGLDPLGAAVTHTLTWILSHHTKPMRPYDI